MSQVADFTARYCFVLRIAPASSNASKPCKHAAFSDSDTKPPCADSDVPLHLILLEQAPSVALIVDLTANVKVSDASAPGIYYSDDNSAAAPAGRRLCAAGE
jgi:hypothetical protein